MKKNTNEELEKFAYGVAHDLQGPLRIVSSYAQLWTQRYKGKTDETGDKYLSYIMNNIQKMQALISHSLSASSIGHQGTTDEKVEVDPAHDRPLNKQEGDQLKILIIEDSQEDMELFVEMLYMKQKYAWDFKRASRLSEALQYLARENFDVIILDLNLPDSRGFDTLIRIRQANPKIPIVVMTGLNDEQFGVMTIRYGAQDYLFKGQITADLFMRSVNYAIERQHLEQVKDDLIAYVNHELSNPLTIIKEGLSQINDGIKGPVNEEQKQFLGITLESIDRLNHIAQTLLESTRLEFGKIQLNIEKCDLTAIVKDLMVTFKSVAASQDVVIRTSFSPDAVWVEADRDRIIQVLTNLLTNALKYTKKGFIAISLYDCGPMVECGIFDTGRGIAREDLSKVFGKYQRFGQYQDPRIKGTGLGLFICKQLVELHHGKIWVESDAGCGSKFIFQLPKKAGGPS